MKILSSKLSQCRQWILSVVIGRFRYRYEYTSPFGEEWIVYRFWFGFIPITYESIANMDFYNSEIDDYVKGKNQKLNICRKM